MNYLFFIEIKKPQASLFNEDDEENDDSDLFGRKAELSSQAVDKSLEVQSKPKVNVLILYDVF